MTKKSVVLTLAAIGLLLSFCGCKNTSGEAGRFAGNAVYHWKNTLNISEADSSFIAQHNIGRMYVRFFDVVEDYSYGAAPSATVDFWSGVPDNVEIVPTVFVTLEALEAMEGHETELADKIHNRLTAMMKGNAIDNVPEVQVDCDWTESTEESFFALCKSLRGMLQGDGMKLSATIRLHQLSRKVPPVDCGVLMLYNTGSVKDMETHNSILSHDVAKQYLRNGDYALPLDFAYPAFSWGVVFSDGRFKRLTRLTDDIMASEGPAPLRKVRDNWYEVVQNSWKHDIDKGDMIRYEYASIKEILKVKKLVEKYYGDKPHSNIIYHLDERELGRYTASQIDDIYE